MSSVRVTATISTTTKEALDRFAEERGLEQSFIIEQALLYFMASRCGLPDEALATTLRAMRSSP